MWTPKIFVAGNSLGLLMLVASLVPCDAFLPPRPRDIASSYGLRIHTPSIFLSNVGRVKTAIAAAATENLEFRSPKLADVDPIADLLVGTLLKLAMPDSILIAHKTTTHSIHTVHLFIRMF